MAVTKLNNWETTAVNSSSTLTLTTVSAGSNRLIVCFVTSEAADPVATAISIGGQAGEEITGSPIGFGSGATLQNISAWIIKETAIAAKSNNVITITFTTQPTTVSISAAVFAGVDQTTPIIEYVEGGSAAATPNPTTTVDLDADSTDNYLVAISGCGNDTPAAWASPMVEQTEVSMNVTATSSISDLDPSSTGNTTVECTWTSQNRRADVSIEIQAVTATFKIDGITKDLAGNVLVSCQVYLVKDNGDDTYTWLSHQVSNGTTGAYSFTGLSDNDPNYQVIAWKDNTPHVFDVTDHVITPVAE